MDIMMPLLSICMPSNRDLSRSRKSIESALAYAMRVGAQLIVSDNSGDLEKRVFFEGRSSNLRYIVSPDQDASANWMRALSGADTPFLLPMGDDDEIRFVDGREPIDLAGLPADVAGVRPTTEIWTASGGTLTTETFTIDSMAPDERLAEYNRKAEGNNSIYYSIFRTDLFVPTMRLFVEAHPTNGGYCDWAIVLSLFTAGRMLHDPSLVYRYDLGPWANDLAEMQASQYRKVGLPEETGNFLTFLMFLDLHIFSLRPSLPLLPEERRRVLMMNCRVLLADFLRQVPQSPEKYDETVTYIAGLIAAERNIDSIIQLSILLTDCIQPGLKDRYVRFLQAALNA
ncbi:hypothetical protein [Pararhizobium sp. O133]|uniref:hypothetical protein n=1 Tax=Pararhizobium sp. O133 TaxID=3449278 RepID=UPI003F68925D